MWRDSLARAKIRVVLGYVRLEDHPRSPQTYYELGQQLSAALGDAPLAVYYERVQDLWLTQFLEKLPPMEPPLRWAQGDNPKKNSLEFHSIQFQKFAWLARAANEDQEADTLVYIDYGIFSQPGMSAEVIREFLKRIRKNDFQMPGCWAPTPDPMAEYPCWRFLGSLMIVPRADAPRLLQLVQAYTRTYVRAMKFVPFEVNVLASIEPMLAKVGLKWYVADHNASQFANYGK
jgi:hypothetical protein